MADYVFFPPKNIKSLTSKNSGKIIVNFYHLDDERKVMNPITVRN
jgi:hypothetical protein